MGFMFPDARAAFYELVPRAVDPAPVPYFQLVVDFADNLPAALIYRVGGEESGPFRQDRINVDVYANGSTAANRVANEIRAFLAGQSHDFGDPAQLLDQVEVEVIPTEAPYMSDTVNVVSATYRVDTRAL
ncbi:MAG TPA: hypothetical protein VGF17_10030 [Phytomonospora sp.]